MEEKVCTKCGELLHISRFSKVSKNNDGLSYICKVCTKDYYKKRMNKFGKKVETCKDKSTFFFEGIELKFNKKFVLLRKDFIERFGPDCLATIVEGWEFEFYAEQLGNGITALDIIDLQELKRRSDKAILNNPNRRSTPRGKLKGDRKAYINYSVSRSHFKSVCENNNWNEEDFNESKPVLKNGSRIKRFYYVPKEL